MLVSKKDDELAEIRNKEIGFVFKLLIYCFTYLLMSLPMIYAGYSKSERRVLQVNLGDDHQQPSYRVANASCMLG
jgi:putative ABC transport system ATP-binding protein